MNVQQYIMPQLQDLFQYLERDFNPLQLCSKVNTIFEFLQENEELELSQYIKPLQGVAIVRLLKQVPSVLTIVKLCFEYLKWALMSDEKRQLIAQEIGYSPLSPPPPTKGSNPGAQHNNKYR